MSLRLLSTILLATLLASAGAATASEMIRVPAGDYKPLLRARDDQEVEPVSSFWMDVSAVTNAEFLEFVRADPRWRRSQVSPLFADSGYLSNWAGDLELGPGAPAEAPVVNVSWFAARAYAAARGARLPTMAEWERAASVGITRDDAGGDPTVQQLMANWFSRPSALPLPAANLGPLNRLGLRNLHGLIWEWVEDFNTALVTGESRADPGLERNLFCGAGSVGARDKTNFPAFLRAGFRSSLRASYAVSNLGFRCVRSP